jgi:hypothetical protein
VLRLMDPTAGSVRFKGERSPASTSSRCASCAATCRSSSRTPTPRSIRA